jgi:transaldolase
MKATQFLYRVGQSFWLDNIIRDLLTSGTLKRYIDELSITGPTSNPTIFDQAIKNSTAYDDAIRRRLSAGASGERAEGLPAVEEALGVIASKSASLAKAS